MLAQFKAGDKIRHIVLCRVQKIGASSNGGVFARGSVSDNSVTMPFVSFDGVTVELLRDITGPTAYVATGLIDINKFANDGSLQLMIQKIEQPLPHEDLSHLLPDGGVDIKKYEQTFKDFIARVNDTALQELLQNIFSGQTYYSFRTNPAGMSYHHAYVSGLLEHSVDVAELSVAMGAAVKDVDTDLLIAGSLLHDLGKLREISQELGFPYTNEGKLLGHISLGVMLVNEAAAKMSTPLPQEKLQALLHIIVSHHGEQEKGSPLVCKMKEAFIVHHADELDSVMNQFRHSEGKGWQYSKMLSRNIYIDPCDSM